MIIAEEAKLVSAFVPVDLAGSAGGAGDYISLKNFEHVSIIIFKDAGVAGDDPIITLTQATTVAGGSAKALDFDKVWTNLGTLTSSDTLTRVPAASIPRSSSLLSTYLNTDSAEVQGIIIIEIDASELDVTNGFDCLKVSIADVGSGGAQLGCGLYLLSNPRFNSGNVNTTAITD